MHDFAFCITKFNTISVSLVKHFFPLIIICGVGMMEYVWFPQDGSPYPASIKVDSLFEETSYPKQFKTYVELCHRVLL